MGYLGEPRKLPKYNYSTDDGNRSSIEPITIVNRITASGTGTLYTVPSGKKLYITGVSLWLSGRETAGATRLVEFFINIDTAYVFPTCVYAGGFMLEPNGSRNGESSIAFVYPPVVNQSIFYQFNAAFVTNPYAFIVVTGFLEPERVY